MIDELENLLKEKNISQADIQKIISGFKNISVNQRMLIFGALSGHPELISVFADLMNKKTDFLKKPSQEKANSIIEQEKNLLENIFKHKKYEET